MVGRPQATIHQTLRTCPSLRKRLPPPQCTQNEQAAFLHNLLGATTRSVVLAELWCARFCTLSIVSVRTRAKRDLMCSNGQGRCGQRRNGACWFCCDGNTQPPFRWMDSPNSAGGSTAEVVIM